MTRCRNDNRWCGEHGICDQCRRDEQKAAGCDCGGVTFLDADGYSVCKRCGMAQ